MGRIHHTFLTLTLLLVFSQAQSFVFYEDTKLWNQDSITFYFLDGTQKQKDEVIKFAKLWQRYTGITFTYTSKKPSVFHLDNYYKITFKGGKNESTTGAINGIIHLGNLSDNIIFRKTTILHEFGHMLGLGHEHQRADRPASLNDQTLVQSCMDNQNQSRKWCQDNLFKKNTRKVFIESEYDPESIMHYEMDNITGEQDPSQNNGFWKNTHSLSYTDKYFIALLYNQNISEKTLEKMHKQDLWEQQKFEKQATESTEKTILNLSSSSCKILKYSDKSLDGKYCQEGFMIIGVDDLSFPGEEFKLCHLSYTDIKNHIDNHHYCQLNDTQLTRKRQAWSQSFAQYGNCQRLDTKEKNNQEYFCTEGYSYVTKNNDLIGEKTMCYSSEESVYEAMKEDQVCNLSLVSFNAYERKMQKQFKAQLKTNRCQIVRKKYKSINCPVDYDYTIIDRDDDSRPLNKHCFNSEYQAINAMNNIPFCKS